MNTIIRSETQQDITNIRQVNRAAFEGDAEANLVDALRDGGYAEVSLVAVIDDEVVGHILFSNLTLVTETGTVNLLSLAPMAVLPPYQRQGIGSILVETGLQLCRELEQQIVVVLGHPTFYSLFGFSAELALPLKNIFGGGEAWMAKELVPDALSGIQGTVEYPPPFKMFE